MIDVDKQHQNDKVLGQNCAKICVSVSPTRLWEYWGWDSKIDNCFTSTHSTPPTTLHDDTCTSTVPSGHHLMHLTSYSSPPWPYDACSQHQCATSPQPQRRRHPTTLRHLQHSVAAAWLAEPRLVPFSARLPGRAVSVYSARLGSRADHIGSGQGAEPTILGQLRVRAEYVEHYHIAP